MARGGPARRVHHLVPRRAALLAQPPAAYLVAWPAGALSPGLRHRIIRVISRRRPGDFGGARSYVDFLYPGVVAMAVLFTSIFSAMSTAEEILVLITFAFAMLALAANWFETLK